MPVTPMPLVLYRVVRASHTTLFPHPGGTGRFDSPDRSYAVLYTAFDRQAALAEALQSFRPDLEVRAALAALRFADITNPPVPLRTWAQTRVMLRIRIPAGAHLLDLRTSAAIEEVANWLAEPLRAMGLTDFDASHLLGPDRRITQAVSAFAWGQGFDGILAPSRLGPEWTSCALFDRSRPRVMSRTPIDPADPDLRAIADRFHLRTSG